MTTTVPANAATMRPLIVLLSTFTGLQLLRGTMSSDVIPSNCMRLTTFNYHYTPTYRLEALDSDKNSPGFTFRFSVQAQSDAHLKLSSTPDAQKSPVTIEIVLGAGANSFSAVRRKPKKTAVDLSNNTPLILSKTEMRSFTLILNGELLTVYANSSSLPILSYEDSSVVDMSYISFGAWNNVAVEWSFDCKDAEVPESPPLDPVLRLKRTYWSRYDPFNPPVLDNSTLTVDVSLSLIHVNLNAKDGIFTMRGKFEVEWRDQKLQWNPEEYGNIGVLNFKHRVIWMPEFELLDVPKSESTILEDRSVRLYHNGSAKWTSLGNVETWCDVDVSDWPADQHECHIHIGLRSHPDTIQLKFAQSPNMSTLETTGLEWEVISITSDENILIGSNETQTQSFKLHITMKRAQTPFMLVFFIPLFVSFGVLMSSYIIAPQHKCRLALVTSCIVVLNLLLIFEDVMLPALPQGTPRIMKITSCLLVMAVLQLVFHSFNAHLVNLSSPAPSMVKNMAKKSWMKYLHQGAHDTLFSEDITDQDFHQFDQADDCQTNLEGREVDMNKYHWALVSRALDMVTFLLSFFILPFLLSPM
uniref:Acetylcholine receptor subunit alpha-L1 n=2 Tax=Lygus hesperus TaxID=30085 RepID=A0A146LI87_LYGHE